MKYNKIKLLVITAWFTALCAGCTACLSIPIGVGGYIHFGDAIILLASSVLPSVFSMFVGAVGGAVADVIVGATIWAPYTLVIKALLALLITNKKETMLNSRNIVGMLISFVVTISGYYVAEAFIYGNWISPTLSIVGNLIQCIGSAVIFVLFSLSLDKIKFKSKINSLIKQKI